MPDANTQAILLLTTYFGKPSKGEAKPLTPMEWGKFAYWLKDQNLYPETLLTGAPQEMLADWSDTKITFERLKALLNRGSAMGVAMEKWTRAGLWVMTRSDPDYPKRLKERLGTATPPIFFGCGNRQLLSQGGIAVVGSRKTSDKDLEYSRQLGAKTAFSGYSIISGGAQGVDEAAMLGALEEEGTAVGVLAKELLRSTSTAKYRQHLRANNLALISPFYPEAGFNTGNAMARNKYIYCLSNAAVAVHSGQKGGTWTGARENMKRKWVPMWVKSTDEPEAGNEALIEQGAQRLSGNITGVNINDLFGFADDAQEPNSDLLSSTLSEIASSGQTTKDNEQPATSQSDGPKSSANPREAATEDIAAAQSSESESAVPRDEPKKPQGASAQSLYEHFLQLLRQKADTPKSNDELLEITQLKKSQLDAWLKRAVEEKKITKHTRPVRYELSRQADWFNDT